MLLCTTRVGGFHPQSELRTSDRPMIVRAMFPLHCRPRGVGDDRDEDRYYTGQSPKRLLQSHQLSVPLLLLLRATMPPNQSVFVPASSENLLRPSLGASPSFAIRAPSLNLPGSTPYLLPKGWDNWLPELWTVLGLPQQPPVREVPTPCYRPGPSCVGSWCSATLWENAASLAELLWSHVLHLGG